MTASTVTREKTTSTAPTRPGLTPISWAIERARTVGPIALKVSLAALFIWFGALKILGASPVAGLIAETVPFLDPAWFIPALGVFEIVLGAALLIGGNLLVLAAALAHLAGTFAVFVTAPELAFQSGNPLLLTTEGEFVMKNLVLLAAVLALVGSRASRASSTNTR